MECRTETRTDFESAAKRQSLSEQDPLRQVPRLTVEEARRQLYGLASGLVRLRKPAGSLLGRARLVGPHRRGGLPLVPEIDTSATLDRLERLARENTELHEELEALGMVLGALQRLGQPTAIERLIPFDELVRTVAGDQQRGDESPLAVPGAGRCHSRGGRLDLWGGAAPSIKEPVMMMRVLVLVAGATGAVGRQLVPRLAAAGHEVHGMTRRQAKRAMLDELGAVPVAADALAPDQVAAAVARAKPEVIVYQLTAIGALDPRHMDRDFAPTNRLRTQGTDYLLWAGQAVGVRRFVAQSNGAVPYARTGGAVKGEEDPLDPSPARELRALVAAIRHLEQAVLGAEWTAMRRVAT